MELLQGPSPPWSHPVLRVWRDGLGHTRAAPNAELIVSADPSCPAARVGRAYLEPGPFFGQRFDAADIRVHSASLVYLGSWCLQLPTDGDKVHACRLLPCPGLPAQLLAVNGDPAFSWSLSGGIGPGTTWARSAWSFGGARIPCCTLDPGLPKSVSSVSSSALGKEAVERPPFQMSHPEAWTAKSDMSTRNPPRMNPSQSEAKAEPFSQEKPMPVPWLPKDSSSRIGRISAAPRP